MPASTYIDPRRLEAMGSTRLRARAVVEGVIAGLHRNPHRGSSVEFAEYKEYAPGDDVRHIDWRAYGRVDRYYVKQFEDETNVRGYLLLDTSGSMDFGFEDAPTKWRYGATLVATLAHLMVRQGDAPGLLCFDERPGAWLPPSARRAQLDDLCRVLDASPPGGRTSVERALARVAETVWARSMVVVVSDLLEQPDELLTLARVLRRRGLEVVVYHVIDRAEAELPYEGLTIFEGLEGEDDLLADPDDLRPAYREVFREHADGMRDRCRAGDIEYFRAWTDTPVEQVVLELVRSRARGAAGRRR